MSKYIEVFKRLKREMNGAVSDAMDERGLEYGLNYGVSLSTIKNIAQQFGPDHNLAQDLYRQEVREMKIAAIYIEDPKMVTIEQANLWSEKWENIEIAQLCAMELLCKSDVAETISKQWFECENQLKHIAACYIVGKLAIKSSCDFLEKFITITNNAYSLREIYKNHTSLRTKIDAIADQVYDLKWQIDYL